MGLHPEKAFRKGSSFPAKTPGLLRLYGMRFCPFVQRTRLVLAHKKIPHEVININLSDKPEWFLKLAPPGTVPVLELADGRIIYESDITCDYLDEAYPDHNIVPDDVYVRAELRIKRAQWSDVLPYHYGLARGGVPSDETRQKCDAALAYYEKLLHKSGQDFLAGTSPGMLDYHIFPWFERFPFLKQKRNVDILENCPLLRQWFERMAQNPVVKSTNFNPETHIAFYDIYVEGKDESDYKLAELDHNIVPDDVYVRAELRIKRAQWSDVLPYHYGLARGGVPSDETRQKCDAALAYYEKLLHKSGQDFLAGTSPGMLDYHIFPWFERFPFLKQKRNVDILENCPLLRQWFERMAQNPVVKSTNFNPETHIAFYDIYVEGKDGSDYKLAE